MVSAGGYILQVPEHRRELLLDEAAHGGSFFRTKPYISEPVPAFDHSRRAPPCRLRVFRGRAHHAHCRWQERSVRRHRPRSAET